LLQELREESLPSSTQCFRAKRAHNWEFGHGVDVSGCSPLDDT
jgi:hypothetical protein